MNNISVSIYATMVKNGRIKIDDVPDEYRAIVKSNILNPPHTTSTTSIKLKELETNNIRGALTLPKIYKRINSNYKGAIYKNEIFGDFVFEKDEDPIDISYTLSTIEYFVPFIITPNISIENGIDGNLVYSFSGELQEQWKDKIIASALVLVKSNNYEDMHLTIYFQY